VIGAQVALPAGTRGQLGIYDVAGRLVRTVRINAVQGEVTAVRLPLDRLTGEALPSGVYLVQLRANGIVQTRRFVCLPR
jgi:hypothetical protein